MGISKFFEGSCIRRARAKRFCGAFADEQRVTTFSVPMSSWG